jgi:sugar phosphate isomerase/epimerase
MKAASGRGENLMGWKFAVHSIAWGNQPLEAILKDAKRAGYSGIELFQHPDELGGAEVIERAFTESGITLVGVAAGSFDERCRLVRDIAILRGVALDDPSLPYVYCDEWRESDRRFAQAVEEGFTIALHPHMFKPVQTLQEAEEILKSHPSVRFLPDTAHLQIAGDVPAAAIDSHASRLIGVHLKSWREDVGRSYQFYARGFCGLGEGDVDLEGVLDAMLRNNFTGWLVVEHDSTTNPLESATRSVAWLKKRLSSDPSTGGVR